MQTLFAEFFNELIHFSTPSCNNNVQKVKQIKKLAHCICLARKKKKKVGMRVF